MLYLCSMTTYIFFKHTFMFIYLLICVTFSGSHFCKYNNMCLNGTWHFVKSTSYCCSSRLSRPTNEWPYNLSGKSWLWSLYFTLIFHLRAIFRRCWLDFEWTITFFSGILCSTSKFIVFSTFTTTKNYFVASLSCLFLYLNEWW